ncbi:UNVERIFIED_CONTAM: protein PLASTID TRANSCRIPTIONALLY ACTIVE 7 [Sesamum calycinum]|uniref:Protein PLASTID TRANSCRIPTIONALLY ACTIVE 7 n=1 Tax=Sesamum calycinum TaxID=2727403 RepID=A0AAW2LSR9_9LAMI
MSYEMQMMRICILMGLDLSQYVVQYYSPLVLSPLETLIFLWLYHPLHHSICFQAKKDDMLDYRMERIPFLEEQVRKIRETGELLTMDIERLLLSEDNRFGFVNEVAAEAKQYVESNRDEYGAKKAIFHVLSNRMNDSGFYRPEAYIEDDPFKPGPGYLRQQLYDV